MPPLPSPGKVIRIRLTATWGDDTNIQNHFYLSYTGTCSGADCVTINSAIDSAWGTHFGALVPATYTLTAVETTDLSSTTGAQVASAFTTSGGASGTAISAGGAVVIHGVIARRFRGGHARVYIAGVMEANLAGPQQLTVAAQGAYNTAWTDVIAAITGSPPADLGVVASCSVSFYNGFTSVQNPVTKRYRNVPTLRPTPLVDPITGWVTNPTIASQRRRNRQSV